MAINAMDSKSWICEQSRAEHGRDRTRGLNQLSKKSRRAGRKGKAVDASQSINFSACQGLLDGSSHRGTPGGWRLQMN